MRFSITFLCFCILFLYTVCPAYSQWEEIPEHGTTIDFGGIFNTKSTALNGTAIHAEENVWLGISGSQITGDGEVISQDLDARVQAGFDWDILSIQALSIQAFVEGERDMDSELTISTGAYLRKVIEYDQLDVLFGFGSLVERDDIKEELGLEEDSPDVLPYYLAIFGVEYDFRDNVGIHGKLIGQPHFALSHVNGKIELGADIILDDNLVLKIQSSTEFGFDNGNTYTDTENSALLSINLE